MFRILPWQLITSEQLIARRWMVFGRFHNANRKGIALSSTFWALIRVQHMRIDTLFLDDMVDTFSKAGLVNGGRQAFHFRPCILPCRINCNCNPNVSTYTLFSPEPAPSKEYCQPSACADTTDNVKEFVWRLVFLAFKP